MTIENENNTSEEGITKELTSEIDAGVESIVNELNSEEAGEDDDPAADTDDDNSQDGDALGEKSETDGDDISDEDDKSGDDDKPDDDDKPVPVSDDILTRAVKAGLSLTDARTFQDADALTRTCELLEAKSKPDDDTSDGDDKDDGDLDIDAVLDAVPDLDPEEYDEGLIETFNGLKDVIRAMQGKIVGMEQKGQESDALSFDKQVDELGESYVDAVGKGKLDPNSPQAQKRAELRGMADVLKSGYEAKGDDVSSAEIFEQAVSVILGAETQAKALAEKTGQLKKRSGQITQRPGGKKIKGKVDAFDEVAEAIDNKFFK